MKKFMSNAFKKKDSSSNSQGSPGSKGAKGKRRDSSASALSNVSLGKEIHFTEG